VLLLLPFAIAPLFVYLFISRVGVEASARCFRPDRTVLRIMAELVNRHHLVLVVFVPGVPAVDHASDTAEQSLVKHSSSQLGDASY
jgi:hypothetical protein